MHNQLSRAQRLIAKTDPEHKLKNIDNSSTSLRVLFNQSQRIQHRTTNPSIIFQIRVRIFMDHQIFLKTTEIAVNLFISMTFVENFLHVGS